MIFKLFKATKLLNLSLHSKSMNDLYDLYRSSPASGRKQPSLSSAKELSPMVHPYLASLQQNNGIKSSYFLSYLYII